ncbi:YbgA family protein [Lacimicrobium alkaliphilum]|uniref:DUF1722 domain-containing protein n=1 Tax=Lacimicrobium alkaliphilum TaxID=1526571 RepID=A0ABQ1RT16_9ALTE|nr:DUF523 and DUF1722 domain-containing protein [Lacimicrobium alkaliphilum]GGD77978.1 hypothetical protein GCM10011357_36320 [Lacimicrobium alkaliphilum]
MTNTDSKPVVGISSCVLGEKVRYDGGHKRSAFVTDKLSEFIRFAPACPEMGIGMPVPRPTIHIREIGQQQRLTDSRDAQVDHTDKMQAYFSARLPQLSQLDGYILAAKSPSCGMERIKVYTPEGELLHRKGQGIFVQMLKQQFPDLPMEEDGRLNDEGLRESFITRIFAYHDFRRQVLNTLSVRALVDFHSRNKMLVMAYSPQAYQALGRLVAGAKGHEETISKQYLTLMMRALSKPTNRRKHTNVLMHLQGYFKKQLDKADKQELCEQIDKYRLGYVPLMAPVTLLRHHLKKYPNDYLQQQRYLQPYPEALGLRA